MIKLISSTRSSLTYIVEINEFSPNRLINAIYVDQPEPIQRWLHRREPDIDILTWEGGIDSWWGMGSVTMFELGLKFGFEYSFHSVTITIS